jgi:hypothetical protein
MNTSTPAYGSDMCRRLVCGVKTPVGCTIADRSKPSALCELVVAGEAARGYEERGTAAYVRVRGVARLMMDLYTRVGREGSVA